MSRIIYGEGDDPVCRLWPATAARVFKGKPGQGFLKELEAALLAMPMPLLGTGEWIENGNACALASLDIYRKMANGMCWDHARVAVEHQMEEDSFGSMDDEWFLYDTLPKYLHTSYTMVWEVVEKNDEQFENYNPRARHAAMLRWVRSHIQGRISV